MQGTPQNKRLLKLYAAGIGLLLLTVGFVAGWFGAKSIGTRQLTNCYASQAGLPVNRLDQGDNVPFTRGMPTEGLIRRQMPPPWSEEAQQWRSAADSQDDGFDGLYTFWDDATRITEPLTVAFLGRLQAHLAATGQNTTGNADLTEVMDQFKEVARDVLNYLRYHRSQALLVLLRQYALQRSLTLADVDPDVLRQEVQELLDLNQLGKWYSSVAQKDHGGITTWPAVGLTANQRTSEMLRGANNNNRHLLEHHLSYRTTASHAARHLHAAAPPPAKAAAPPATAPGGAPIPIIPAAEAVVEDVPPTVSPLMTMGDMLCTVRQFSPTGLQGMLLPDQNNTGSAGKPIKCGPAPQPTIFRYQDLVFNPVKIPVVFHCQRFMMNGVELPPMWSAEESAANLIKVANKAFELTHIQFELQEVRYDTKKYPYLLLSTVKDWQDCTGNPSQEAAGFPCLAQTAAFDDVAALIKKYVINIIVGGSTYSKWCNGTEEESCSNLYAGYTGSIGPWFARPSQTWSEDSVAENWITITWDEFSPAARNSKRFWDGGGITVAHELGHYLGLMHTHEGAVPCEGDGLNKADAVPDTPVNLQTTSWAASNGLAVKLSRWCTQFREGKKPVPRELLAFKSCKQEYLAIDNVFNMLSYLPDQCCMMMTANQIARLQWAIARFRPKMMAKYSV